MRHVALPAFEPSEFTAAPTTGQVIGLASWGPLVTSSDIDDAILDVLQVWMATHLRRLKEERGVQLQLPREWAIALTDAELLDHPLPAVVSQTASLQAPTSQARESQQGAQGGMARFYGATWRSQVSVTVRGRDARETRRTSSLWEGVIRRLMVQHAHVTPLDWIRYLGMSLDPVPGDERSGRYLLRSTSVFQIRSNNIVDPTAGPNEPDLDEYNDPVSETVDVVVEKEPLL